MTRFLNLALLIAFQFCYLEWPPNNSMFLFQGEVEIFTKTESWISNFAHPIILIGFITQIVLLLGTILPNLNKKINNLAIYLLAFLVIFITLVGILSLNYRIVLATFPFLILFVIYIVKYRKV